jgi:hypothetical protein
MQNKMLGRFGSELYRFTDPKVEGDKLMVGRGEFGDWTCLDAFGGAFKTENHIWVDFNLVASINLGQWLNLIVVDWSTWRYLKVNASKSWCDLLHLNGKLMFENGAASYTVTRNASGYSHGNPCHLMLTVDQLNEWTKEYTTQINIPSRQRIIRCPKSWPKIQSLDSIVLWKSLDVLKRDYNTWFGSPESGSWSITYHNDPNEYTVLPPD